MGRDLEELTRAVNGVIARRVSAQRAKLGMSLAELAEASGVGLSKLDRLEHRRTGCSAIELWKISLALDISISELCEPGRGKTSLHASQVIRLANRPALEDHGALGGPDPRLVH